MATFPTGHVSLVTGSSSGIGAAVAVTLAERGSCVAVHYRANESAAQNVVEQITGLGGRAFTVQAGLARTNAAQSLVNCVLGRCKRLDLLVNNAGSIFNRLSCSKSLTNSGRR